MRVVLVSPFLNTFLRGVERFTVSLANELVALGVDTHIITWRHEPPCRWEELSPKVVIHTVFEPRYFRLAWITPAYAMLLRRLNPDVVHLAFTWHGEEGLAWLAPKIASRITLTLHFPNRYDTFRRSRLMPFCRAVVAVTAAGREDARRWLGVEPVLIPEGVDTRRFCPGDRAEARKRLGLAPDDFVVITIAALERRKGVHLALEAMALVPPGPRKLVYLVAGDGAERAALAAMIPELKLEGTARLLGVTKDILTLYHAADIFLLPSVGEAFALVILEAMSCGVPLVALNVPPMPEVCDPNGAVLTEGKPQAIAGALAQLRADPERLSRMGKANRLAVLDRLDWGKVGALYYDLFRSVAASAQR